MDVYRALLPNGLQLKMSILAKCASWMTWIGCTAILASQSTAQTLPVFVETAEQVGLTLMNIGGETSTDYIIQSTGNGAGFFDFDIDDDLDLVIANGSTLERYGDGGDPVAALYENRDGVFVDFTQDAGLNATGWAHGVCVADYDNDGNRDFYVTAYGANLLYRNQGDGIGARVEIDMDGRIQVGEVRNGGSYLYHNDMRLHFGLGNSRRVDAVRVRWPNDDTERFEGLDADRI